MRVAVTLRFMCLFAWLFTHLPAATVSFHESAEEETLLQGDNAVARLIFEAVIDEHDKSVSLYQRGLNTHFTLGRLLQAVERSVEASAVIVVVVDYEQCGRRLLVDAVERNFVGGSARIAFCLRHSSG